MKNEILSNLRTECPWRDTLYWYDSLDSTNTRAKALAKDGAPHGTVLIAGEQTSGRGRMGRSFSSVADMGVYLSVILRPNCLPAELMHLTCAVALASCKAVELASGVCPDIKWTNDLVYGKKKLGGILTELGLKKDGSVDYAIIGIGINCRQQNVDFPAQLQGIATSIREITCTDCSPARLAGALVDALYAMDQVLLSKKTQLMNAYRNRCITLGQEIMLLQEDGTAYGTALDLDENGGLLVHFSDGTEKIVTSGEVSIRGMYGYV